MNTQSSISSLIDETLANFFADSLQKASAMDPYYGKLWENIQRLSGSGGKRLRPKIVALSYRAFGGIHPESIIPIACAHELLHFSMLIHDDVIDRDTTRYGVDNISGSYNALYQDLVTSANDRMHYANSAAIMAGDLMIAGAHMLISQSGVDHATKQQVQDIMYDSIFNVAGGELLDTESSFRPMGAINPIKVTEFKTASYSFVGPFVTGATLAHAPQQTIDTLKVLATNLGIAYQLTDDMLGVFGDESVTGKSNTGDIREGKKTYLIARTVELLDEQQTAVFNSSFGRHDASDSDINDIKNLIVTSGAQHEIEQKIDDYIRHTRKALDALSLEPGIYEEFDALITKATKRDY